MGSISLDHVFGPKRGVGAVILEMKMNVPSPALRAKMKNELMTV